MFYSKTRLGRLVLPCWIICIPLLPWVLPELGVDIATLLAPWSDKIMSQFKDLTNFYWFLWGNLTALALLVPWYLHSKHPNHQLILMPIFLISGKLFSVLFQLAYAPILATLVLEMVLGFLVVAFLASLKTWRLRYRGRLTDRTMAVLQWITASASDSQISEDILQKLSPLGKENEEKHTNKERGWIPALFDLCFHLNFIGILILEGAKTEWIKFFWMPAGTANPEAIIGYITGTATVFLAMTLWFFTCRAWWKWAILSPLWVYGNQLLAIWGKPLLSTESQQLTFLIPSMIFLWILGLGLYRMQMGMEPMEMQLKLGKLHAAQEKKVAQKAKQLKKHQSAFEELQKQKTSNSLKELLLLKKQLQTELGELRQKMAE